MTLGVILHLWWQEELVNAFKGDVARLREEEVDERQECSAADGEDDVCLPLNAVD